MLKLTRLIPDEERIKAATMREKSVSPTKKSMAAIRERLLNLGYVETNQEVFKAICSYGALLMDGTARKGLMLKGECGIGKTLGVECLAAIFKMPVLIPENFASDYKDCEGNLDLLEKHVLTGYDYYEEPHNIVIDEIGSRDTVRNFGETADIMATVLDMRYRAFLKYGVLTIVTTNLTDREITARYGLRIEDRIAEMFYVRRVTGVSLRKNPPKL